MHAIFNALEQKTDAIAKKLEQKTVTIPVDLVTGILMALFALFILFNMESEVPVGDNHVVNGRAFPTLLMWVMLFCCAILIIKDVIKLMRGQQIEYKTLNMLVEVKAIIIFSILLLFLLLSSLTDYFLLGSIFCVLGFLVYFKCKKPSYYIIALSLAIAIWAAFYFGLKVRF